MNFKIGDTLDYESVIGLGICSGKVVGVSNVGEGQPLYATVRNQKGNDITVHWTRVVKVHPGDSIAHVQTDGSHSDLKSEVERLYIEWSKEIALAAEAKVDYEKVLMEKDVEILRLKEDLRITIAVCNENTDLKKLITELCDALEMTGLREYTTVDLITVDVDKLVERAREAVHGNS